MRSAGTGRWVVVALAVATIVALLIEPGSAARAGDAPLTPGMKKAIDESLFVFTGEVIEKGAPPEDTGSVRQEVEYRVVRVLKGACLEAEVTVEHVVSRHPDPDPKRSGLDRKLFAKGARLVLGVQLRPATARTYSLVNSSRVVGVVPWSEEIEKGISEYAASNARAVQPDSQNPAAAQEARDRAKCISNLVQLSQLYLTTTMENLKRAQRYSGPSLWLQYRKMGTDIRRGQEAALLCPCDRKAHASKTESDREAWDSVDLDRPAEGLCSYAGRDFAAAPMGGPTESDDRRRTPLGACLHHTGGVVIVYSTCAAEFLTLEELGLASEAEKVVGPASKSPLLRVLR